MHLIESHFVEGVLEHLEAIAAHGEVFQIFNTDELDFLIKQFAAKTVHKIGRSKDYT